MNVEQFAYLKCPSKIRAAIINEGGPRLSVEAIERKLGTMSRRIIRVDVGEPTEADGQDFRVIGLVKREPVKPMRLSAETRARIAKLALAVKDRPAEERPKRQAFRYRRPAQPYTVTKYASRLIDDVCAALDIPREAFSSDSRQKFLVAARALVVKLLRERSVTLYSYPRIAEIVGRGDHSTMINAMRKFDHYCTLFPEIAALYLEMREGGE